MTSALYDKMTETVYTSPLKSFKTQETKANWYEVDVLGRGIEAMAEVNTKLGWYIWNFIFTLAVGTVTRS